MESKYRTQEPGGGALRGFDVSRKVFFQQEGVRSEWFTVNLGECGVSAILTLLWEMKVLCVIISPSVLVNTEKDYYAFITCEEVQASAAVKELKQTEAVLFTLPEATISETSQHVHAVLTFSVYNHPTIPRII